MKFRGTYFSDYEHNSHLKKQNIKCTKAGRQKLFLIVRLVHIIIHIIYRPLQDSEGKTGKIKIKI